MAGTRLTSSGSEGFTPSVSMNTRREAQPGSGSATAAVAAKMRPRREMTISRFYPPCVSNPLCSFQNQIKGNNEFEFIVGQNESALEYLYRINAAAKAGSRIERRAEDLILLEDGGLAERPAPAILNGNVRDGFVDDAKLRRLDRIDPGIALVAQKRTRTSTPSRAPAPEADASTNSAIWEQKLTC